MSNPTSVEAELGFVKKWNYLWLSELQNSDIKLTKLPVLEKFVRFLTVTPVVILTIPSLEKIHINYMMELFSMKVIFNPILAKLGVAGWL